MSASPFVPARTTAEDRRAHPRRVVDQEAQFVIPGENMAIPCRVVNISAGGAKITCDAIPESGSKVLLILTTGECFEGVTARYGEGELALKFAARS
jgi:hypothetical protein